MSTTEVSDIRDAQSSVKSSLVLLNLHNTLYELLHLPLHIPRLEVLWPLQLLCLSLLPVALLWVRTPSCQPSLGGLWSRLDDVAHRWYQGWGPWVAAVRNMLTVPCSHCYNGFIDLCVFLCSSHLSLASSCISCVVLNSCFFPPGPLQRSPSGIVKPLIGVFLSWPLSERQVCLGCPMSMMLAIRPGSQRVMSVSNTTRLHFREGHWESVP